MFDHSTSRTCPACGGGLLDSIINFGEALPKQEIDNAFKHADMADLCIVLGSSLRCAASLSGAQNSARQGRKGGHMQVSLLAT